MSSTVPSPTPIPIWAPLFDYSVPSQVAAEDAREADEGEFDAVELKPDDEDVERGSLSY